MRAQAQPARRKGAPLQASEKARRCRSACLCAMVLLVIVAVAALPSIMRRTHPFYPQVSSAGLLTFAAALQAI